MENLETFDDHPSLSASLEDFEHNDRSPTFGLPSQHSGFKSDESEPEADCASEGPWSPPAWRRQTADAAWYRHQPYAQNPRLLKPSKSPSRSRNTSPQSHCAEEAEGDTILPASIPLPRGSMSPVKEHSPSPGAAPRHANKYEDEALSDRLDGTSAVANNCKLPNPKHLRPLC